MSLVRNYIFNFTILFFMMVLCGCSSFKKSSIMVDRDSHYLNAKSIPPLRMPPGLSSSTFHNTYPVAEHQYPRGVHKVGVVPPGL